MDSNTQEYVDIPLRLKTKESIFGRLQNINFISRCVIDSIFNYYWHGPTTTSQNLRFHIIKNVLQKYLAESLPHDLPNELSEKIDFEYISEYIAMNNPPSRMLTSDVGQNREFDICVDPEIITRYSLERYGLSGDKLVAMAEEDLGYAKNGQGRTISCQIVIGANITRENSDTSSLLSPDPLNPNEKVILFFHGGAYCVGERSLTHLYVYANVSSTTGLRVFSPNYRLAPKYCFPSQLHDCLLAYNTMLSLGFKPENIIISGDSAGGSLAVSLVLILKEMSMPFPAGLVLLSPWVDSTCSGASWNTNQKLDYLPTLSFEDPFHPTRMFYAAGRRFDKTMFEELKCPLISPVFGDLAGMPSMLIQLGNNELLRDDICGFSEKVKQQNSDEPNLVKLEVYPDMPHVFVLLHFAPAAQMAFASIGKFVKSIWK
ncbi:Alpha/Beta hydrolase protein [Coemansia spiralis]|nr:Alpha/Beta hydrolase protein [Coemansia spiralis]